MLTLLLVCCGAAVAENPEAVDIAVSEETVEDGADAESIAIMPEPGWVLDSVYGAPWQSDRASLEVFLEDVDTYKVLITWGGSAWEAREWTYACNYDAQAQTLNAEYVICDAGHFIPVIPSPPAPPPDRFPSAREGYSV